MIVLECCSCQTAISANQGKPIWGFLESKRIYFRRIMALTYILGIIDL